MANTLVGTSIPFTGTTQLNKNITRHALIHPVFNTRVMSTHINLVNVGVNYFEFSYDNGASWIPVPPGSPYEDDVCFNHDLLIRSMDNVLQTDYAVTVNVV